MVKKIKLWDGWQIEYEREDGTIESNIFRSPVEVWDYFGWDIENDSNASECASIITREMYCFGQMDLSQLNHGRKLHLSVVSE